MDDAACVRLPRGFAYLQRYIQSTGQRYCASCRRQRALQRQTRQVLHDDVRGAVGKLPHEQDLHDVRVGETGRHLRLPPKSADESFVRRELTVQNLYGNVAIDAALESPINTTRCAQAHELPNLDVPEKLSPDVRIARGLDGNGSREGRERSAIDRTEERIRGVARPA